MANQRVFVAITGASGALYAARLIEMFARKPDCEVLVSATDAGRYLLKDELGAEPDASDPRFEGWLNLGPDERKRLRWIPVNQLGAGPTSGSFPLDAMAVVPCSMRTLGAIAAGIADHVISRSADVCLKEGRRLVIAPRESPLSAIHLENMLRLSHAGARIVPLCPGFYHKPREVEDLVRFMVERIAAQMGFPAEGAIRWAD